MQGFVPLSTTPLSGYPPIDVVSGGALPLASVNALANSIFSGSAGLQVIGTATSNANSTFVFVSSINGSAQVNTNAVYEALGASSVSSITVVVLDANRFTFGDASITVEATVNSGYVVLKLTSATLLSEATVSIIASATFSPTGSPTGVAMTDLTVERTTFTQATVNGVAQYRVVAELVGEGWSVLPQGTNVWLQKG